MLSEPGFLGLFGSRLSEPGFMGCLGLVGFVGYYLNWDE
jgi:hypothetical protein